MLIMPLTAADKLTQEEKNSFVEFYKKHINLNVEEPKKSWVKVMFVDVDGDGHIDALASDALSTYEKSQADWAVFRFTGDKWIPFKGVDDLSKKIISGASLFGRSDEFFRVIKNDGALQFLILQKNFDKKAPQGLGDPIKSWFEVDKNGVIREHKITNIERYLAYDEKNLSSPISSLNRLEVEVFN